MLSDESRVYPAALVDPRRPHPDVGLAVAADAGTVADNLDAVAIVQLADLIRVVIYRCRPDRQPAGLEIADGTPRTLVQADLAIRSAGDLIQFVLTQCLHFDVHVLFHV